MFSDTFILVTGADLEDRETILDALGDQCHIVAAQTAEDALAHLGDSIDLVITELQSGQLDAMELLRHWKLRQPRTPFLVMTDGRDVSSAVEAMKNGAADCIVKPLDPDELRSALELMNSHGAVPGLPRSSASRVIRIASRQSTFRRAPRSRNWSGRRLNKRSSSIMETARTRQRRWAFRSARCSESSRRGACRSYRFRTPAPNNNFIMPTHAASHSIFSSHVH